MSAQPIDAARLIEILGVLDEEVLVMDRDRTILFVSRPVEGYETAEVMGRDGLDFVEPEFRQVQMDLYRRVLDTKEAGTYEIAVTDAEGERQWREGKLIPIVRDGEVDAVVITTSNVTKRHLAQAEAEKLRTLVPVCSWCKKVRDDEGYWQGLEGYIEHTAKARVTHGMCPECERDVLIRGEDVG